MTTIVDSINLIHFVSLHGQIELCKGIQKGWQCDNILVFLKEFGL
jgi:hypothetical protein